MEHISFPMSSEIKTKGVVRTAFKPADTRRRYAAEGKAPGSCFYSLIFASQRSKRDGWRLLLDAAVE